MAMTVRLPDDLAARGRRYAAEVGVSLNGLLAVALREYLDARTRASPLPTPTPAQLLGRAVAQQVKLGPVRQRRR